MIFSKKPCARGKKLIAVHPITKKQVLNEIVWNNHHIKIDGYSVYDKKWNDAGLPKIEDFFQGNRFLAFDEFCSKFEIETNFLNYYGLYHAVPQKWINILKAILLNL